jgi:hypothetical protein
MTYKNIGNITGPKPGPKIVRPHGLITSPDLVMKLYSMLSPGEEMDLESAKDFVQGKIMEGEIKPYQSGMGFTILSDGVVNATVWGAEYPILGKNEVYFFSDPKLSDATRLDLNKEGAYCLYEAQILAFEGARWLEYLRSDKREQDKEKYLDATLDTVID